MRASWTTTLEAGRQSLLSLRAVAGESRSREDAAVVPWGQPADWRSALPAYDQELLLKAALLSDQRGRDAWAELRPRLDLDALDAAAWPVLPMLYRNLKTIAPDEPALPRLHGIRRFLWAQNQLLLGELMPLVGALEADGIRTVLLKGAALLTLLDDPGLRPMRDLDVLVPEAAQRQALDALGRAGLIPLGGVSRDWVEWVIAPATPGYSLQTPGGHELDLHWHAMHQSRQRGADAELWAGTRPVELAGVATRVPDPADQLLHTVCHSMRWDPRPSYRWVVDAWQLLSQPIDFERLVEQARKRRLTVPAHVGLSYLVGRFGAPIPARAMDALERSRGSLVERAELWAQLKAPHDQSPLARAVLDHQSQIRRRVSAEEKLTPAARARVSLASMRVGQPSIGPRPPVGLAEPVRFGRLDNSAPYVVRGMALPEHDGCWTVGGEARLVLPLVGPPDRGRVLAISAHPFTSPGHPRQRLVVVANGRVLATWTGTAEGHAMRRAIVLPPSVMAGEACVDLRLRTPDACSPRSVGAGGDARQLGWFLSEITISAIEPYELGTELRGDAEQGVERRLVGGWWPAEPGGRWTATREAGLVLRVEQAAEALELELDAAALPPAKRWLRVAVLVNGRPEAALRFDTRIPEGRGRVRLSGVRAGEEIELAMRLRNTASPSDLGLGEDSRQLGLFLRRLVLRRAATAHRPAPIRVRKPRRG